MCDALHNNLDSWNRRIILILKPHFLVLNLSISYGIVSSKIYNKRDDFNFEIVNFPFLDGDVPRSPSYVYKSQVCVLLECVLMLMTSTT